MTDAIADLVTSLGDFPLDPDAGRAWLWSGGGDRLLWRSPAAEPPEGDGAADAALVRSFAPLLALAEPDREPIRVHQLAPGGPRGPVHTCLCRHVPLGAGGFGLLAVAIGARARSMAAVRGEAPEREDGDREILPAGDKEFHEAGSEAAAKANDQDPHPEVLAEGEPRRTHDGGAPSEAFAVAKAPQDEDRGSFESEARGEAAAGPEPAPPAAPVWTLTEPADRSPIRFVWQTDEAGRFIHVSRELAAAVGPGRAMLLGRTWEEFARAVGIAEAESVTAGFRSGDTWTAAPALWPVENADLGVPVEMAGLKVTEAGRFDGFRGYGIARIERSAPLRTSVAEALAGEPRAADEMTVAATVGSEDLAEDAEPARPEPPREAVPPIILAGGAFSDEPGGEAFEALADAEAPEAETVADRPDPAIAQEAAGSPVPRDLRRKPQASEIEPPAEASPPPLAEAPRAAEAEEIDPNSPLSAAEREAFREIAKALGAMTENLGRPSAARAQSAAARDVRPLEILKRDIVRLGGAAAGTPPPIDLEQARRQRQPKPEPLQAAAPALLDAVPAGLLVVQDGRPVFANRHLLELAGYSDFETFRTEGGADRLFLRASPEAPTDLRRFEIANRAGAAIVVEAKLQSIAWDGAPAALTTFRALQDPSAAKLKAQELEARAAQAELRELRAVLDTATDGVILLDGEGRILSLNRSAEALFGYDQNEIAGEKLTALLDQDSHLAALDYLDGLKSNGVNSILNDGRDVRGRERNGGAIPLFMTIGRVGEREGGAKFCAVLRDVTHWKKVEADLLEAKRAAEDANAHKSDFLAKISHELRTPLNAVIGFSQVMMSESFGPIGNERYRQYARDIHASGEHVVSLVNDLLDLSKIAAGRLDLAFGSVDVNAAVAESVAMIQPQANAGKVIVRSQLAPDLPAVVADERSLRQIMLNLLSNAAKFTEAGGQVVASTSLSAAGEVVIRVSDTGIGMAEEEVRRAMEPFRQIPGPRSSGGTGLGLPLTKALVEANRASFAIRSEPRKGTLVEVVFPSTRVLAE